MVVLANSVAHRRITGVTSLDLECCMSDLEAFTKLLLEPPNKVLAVRRIKVFGDDHVAAQS
jgi:hypothetical protein